MKKYLLFLMLLITTPTSYSYADDTAFGGTGAVPMPIEQTNVKMLAERVIIRGININNPNLRGQWDFNCLYTLKNMTANPLQFKMGFPFPITYREENVAVPAGEKINIGSPLVYHFKVTINGRPVNTEATKISSNILKNLYYNDAYQWHVKFKPYQTLYITHNYTTGITYDVMSHHWLRFVLRTGGLWQSGVIDRAQLEVVPNTPTRLCSAIDKQFAQAYKTTPVGMKIIGEGID